MSYSLNPDQDRLSVGLHLDFYCLQKAIVRRQNSPLTFKELKQLNTLVLNVLSHIGSFNWDIHVYVYHKYLDTLNTFRQAMSFK